MIISIIISIITGCICYIFSSFLGSNYTLFSSNSYYNVVILFLCFISVLISFWGSLIFIYLKKQEK